MTLGSILGVLALVSSIWPVPRSDRGSEEDSGPPFPLDALFAFFLLIWEGVKWLDRLVGGQSRASRGE
jgi:hypothetical protein